MKKLRIILSNDDAPILCFERDDDYLKAFSNLDKAIELDRTFYYNGMVEDVGEVTFILNPAHIVGFVEVKE